jgi:calcyphosin-like protein
MNANRVKLIEKAFAKLDKNNDGHVTFEDLKLCYNVKSNPEYQNGQQSEKQLLNRFLSKFESNGTVDGIVSINEMYFKIYL